MVRQSITASSELCVIFAEALTQIPQIQGAIALTLRQAGDSGPFRLVISATFEPEDETTDKEKQPNG